MFGVDSADITVAENDLPALALNYGGNREVAEGQGIDVELDLTNGGPQGLHEPLAVRLASDYDQLRLHERYRLPLNGYYPAGNEFGDIPDHGPRRYAAR